jgi:hypothetical protein
VVILVNIILMIKYSLKYKCAPKLIQHISKNNFKIYTINTTTLNFFTRIFLKFNSNIYKSWSLRIFKYIFSTSFLQGHIDLLQHSNWRTLVIHNFRKTNCYVDCLTNKGHVFYPFFWLNFSKIFISFLSSILIGDVMYCHI